jgi:hypothetical protein
MEEEEKKEHKQGMPWTKAGTYTTYEEAKQKAFHMSLSEPTYNFKIKRSGPDGINFTIKKRIDPRLAEIDRQMEVSLNLSKNSRNSKKSQRSSKKKSKK